MKRAVNFFTISFFLWLPVVTANAQNRNLETHISLIGSGGIAWQGTAKWYYEIIDSDNSAPLYPGLSISTGIEVGPLARFYGTLVYSSLEFSYGEENSKKQAVDGSIEAGIQRLPIMMWGKFVSETELSPFLRVGAGAAKTDYREIATYLRGPNIRFNEWHFCLGLGAGFNYHASDAIELETFMDAWVSLEELATITPSGSRHGIFGSLALMSGGIRILYSL